MMKLLKSRKGEEAIGSDLKNIILALMVILAMIALYLAAKKILFGML